MLLLLLLVSHPRLTIQVLFLGDPGPILIFGGPIFTKSFLNFEFLSYNLGGFAYFLGAFRSIARGSVQSSSKLENSIK